MSSRHELLRKVELALGDIPSDAASGSFAHSIREQLLWCRERLSGRPVEDAPGPLTIARLAVREYDGDMDRERLVSLLCELDAELNMVFFHA
ncbi:hypothetical protein ACXR0O_12510 [Verrucomicrobiota bacterium sgz303538]